MERYFAALVMVLGFAIRPVAAQEIPNTMSECEGNGSCGVWTFSGMRGTGRWPHGAFANLILERFDAGGVVIRRTDPSGFSAGLTAVYTGTLLGTRVDGSVTWTWPGHWNNKPATGKWYATFASPKRGESLANKGKQLNDSLLPPNSMHWCAEHCSTWIWTDGRYVAAGTPNPKATPPCGMTVETFTRESVIMHRIDCGEYPGTALLTGRLSSDANSIVDGTITWTYHPCCGLSSGPFEAAWGNALSSVPGSDEERERRARANAAPTEGQNSSNQTAGQTNHTKICMSKQVRAAMKTVEDQSIHDPNGAALSGLVAIFTGVYATSGSATLIGSKDGADGGRYTSKDPGSFVCRGFFIHGDISIDALPGLNDNAEIMTGVSKEFMEKHPMFIEWFKVKPLQNGRYLLTLLPSSIQLSREYSKEFTYTAQRPPN